MLEKKYRLLKDLPDAKAGQQYIYNKSYNRYYLDGNVLGSYWDIEYVQDNPEWFELVTEPSIVPERIIVNDLYLDYKKDSIINGKQFHRYKFSVLRGIKDTEIPKIQKAIENVINDTVVEPLTIDGKFIEGREYTRDEMDKILKDFRNQPLQFCSSEKTYTQSEVDAIMEDTWWAARLTNPLAGMKYDTFADYKATLPLQQEKERGWIITTATEAKDKPFWTDDLVSKCFKHLTHKREDLSSDWEGVNREVVKYREAHQNDYKLDYGMGAETVKDNKGWEIVSYINIPNNEVFSIEKVRNNTIYYEGFKDNTGEFSKHSCFKIHSVKRLSDNCVFSVGEKRFINGYINTIKKFEISEITRNIIVYFNGINIPYDLSELPTQPPTDNATDTPSEELMYNISSTDRIHPKNDLCSAFGCVKYDERIHK